MVREANYGFWDVYHMPISMRRHLLRNLTTSIKNKQNEILKQQNKPSEILASDLKNLKKKIKEDQNQPYVTKASKK